MGAENGTLAVMVGGDEDTLEAVRPVLDHLATDIVHVGDVGAGQMTKLCNNMLTAIITTALGEVLVTGVKAGVELEPLTEALGAGSGGNYVLSGYLPNTLFTERAQRGLRPLADAQGPRDCSSGRPATPAWSSRSAIWCTASTSRRTRRGSTTPTRPASPSSTSAPQTSAFACRQEVTT